MNVLILGGKDNAIHVWQVNCNDDIVIDEKPSSAGVLIARATGHTNSVVDVKVSALWR
jgi:hypothetical protein